MSPTYLPISTTATHEQIRLQFMCVESQNIEKATEASPHSVNKINDAISRTFYLVSLFCVLYCKKDYFCW